MNRKEKLFPLPLESVIPSQESDNAIRVSTVSKNRASVLDKPVSLPKEKNIKKTDNFTPVRSIKEESWSSKAIALSKKVAALGIQDPLVLSAIESVPRHIFISEGLAKAERAYEDISLPIGLKQTISRPYTVARMIEAVRVGLNEKKLKNVLEVGTGCGYQAAILSKVAENVYSIERIKQLNELARKNLRKLRISNLRLQYGDGMLGLPEVAPFDAIGVAAAGLEVPEALLMQLEIGGHLIAPIGEEKKKQTLQLVKRTGKKHWQSAMIEDCHFVPLLQGVI